jgi:DNA primase
MTDQRGLPFIDAVKELVQAAGMEMPEQDRQSVERAERAKGLHEAMAEAATWFADKLNGIEGGEARSVLDRRGIKPETARDFGMGFSPDSRGKLREALKNYGDEVLVEAGLLIKIDDKEPYDRFRGRLMIPIRDARGRTIAFGGRVIGEGEPKYLNSPDTPLFDKGRTLYNIDRAAAAARKAERVITVEGYMDVISLSQAGFEETVAPLGTALTEHQLERLWRLSDVPLLCFDGDKAGKKASVRAAHRALPYLQPGRSLAFVTLPEELDPDDLIRAQGPAAFEALLRSAEPLVDRIWRDESDTPTNTPEERAGLGARLRALAVEISDEDVRKQYLATFNRMVWDHFHPERPSKSFGKFGQVKDLFRGPIDRMKAIADHGIAQATFIPAMMAGFLRHPHMIQPISEQLGDVGMNSIPLRQVRERMLKSALPSARLDASNLRAKLREEGLDPVVKSLDQITLAFSYLKRSAPQEQAEKDLALVTETLAYRPVIKAQVERSRQLWEHSSNVQDYEAFERMLKYRHEMEESFKEAMMPPEDAYAD